MRSSIAGFNQLLHELHFVPAEHYSAPFKARTGPPGTPAARHPNKLSFVGAPTASRYIRESLCLAARKS